MSDFGVWPAAGCAKVGTLQHTSNQRSAAGLSIKPKSAQDTGDLRPTVTEFPFRPIFVSEEQFGTHLASIFKESVSYARECGLRHQIQVGWKVRTFAHRTVRQTLKSDHLGPIS